MRKGLVLSEDVFKNNKDECNNLLTNYLSYNGIKSLEALDSNY